MTSCLIVSVECSKKEKVQNTENNKPSASEVVQEQLIDEEQSQDPIQYVIKESSAIDEKLEESIVNALSYNKKANGPLRYYYNRIDLNRDQNPETFVYLLGPYVSGSGGSTALIFEGKEDNYKLVSQFTL